MLPQHVIDKPYADMPVAFVLYGVLSAIVVIGQVVVTFIFPATGVCFASRPLECTFPPKRILLGIGFTTILGIIETARVAVTALYTHEE